MARLSILTLNAGLAVARLFGKTLYAPAPFVDERAAMLPVALERIDADVIALQEVYELSHRTALAYALRKQYPFAAACDEARSWSAMGHGLMVLSKHPFAWSGFEAFQHALADDALVVRKGFLNCGLTLPDFGTVMLMNAHATAGGLLRHPERESVEAVRQGQIDQMLHAERNGADHVLLAGDLNAGPGVSDGNYRSILAAGYADAYAQTAHDDLEPNVTWEPRNALNSSGPHRDCPPQRIDHLFVRSADDARPLRVRESSIMLHAPCVIVNGGRVTVSDHFGLLATLET